LVKSIFCGNDTHQQGKEQKPHGEPRTHKRWVQISKCQSSYKANGRIIQQRFVEQSVGKVPNILILHRSVRSVTVQAIDLFRRKKIENHADEKHQPVYTQYVDKWVFHRDWIRVTKIKIIQVDSVSLRKIRNELMKRLNPWAFGMVFLCVAAYILWNDVNVGMLFSLKNDETKAYVTKVFTRYNNKYRALMPHIEYVYVVDSTVYKDVKYVKSNQFVGNSLRVKYSVNNPIDNQIETFHNEFQENKSQTFLSTLPNGYGTIKLLNGLYFRKEEKSGQVLLDEIGMFVQKQDTLVLTTFLKDKITKRFVMNGKEIRDVITERIYK